METASIPCKVHQCSKCPGDTEYYCVSCPCDLCPQCKEDHVKDLKTIDHDVVSHRDKINYIPTQEICRRVIRPLQFLSSIKTALPQIHPTLHTSQLSMTESLNKEDVMESLNRVWVSDGGDNLILTDTTGVPLHRVEDSCRRDRFGIGGFHTVNKRTDSTWEPLCVYWSPSTGDLLVWMRYNRLYTDTSKLIRYNQSGQLTQTIQHDNTGRGLYREPIYITENNNGDVVVSDSYRAVVVTERGGRHRFSYTGHPSGSGLQPRGICTDALSHILVCDGGTKTVQMLDKDGQFLSHLLTKSQEMGEPCSLSYDVNTHRLWVRSWDDNKVCVYRYITRQDALTDQSRVMESLSGIPTPGTEKPQQGNQCLLKLMSPPELLHSPTVTGVDGCDHISCVTSERVWVSDYRNNLILTDTTGVPLHHVEDSCSDSYDGYGLHTVNSETELIYIDRNYNINKLSKDMKTTTTFIKRTYYTLKSRCVSLLQDEHRPRPDGDAMFSSTSAVEWR
eukprot:XP_019929009.1 PREDICTED: uncharacterized protein LOC109620626 [Crassostrea gigas]